MDSPPLGSVASGVVCMAVSSEARVDVFRPGTARSAPIMTEINRAAGQCGHGLGGALVAEEQQRDVVGLSGAAGEDLHCRKDGGLQIVKRSAGAQERRSFALYSGLSATRKLSFGTTWSVVGYSWK